MTTDRSDEPGPGAFDDQVPLESATAPDCEGEPPGRGGAAAVGDYLAVGEIEEGVRRLGELVAALAGR